MVEPTSHDNEGGRHYTPWPEPDAHGQAAMLLAESLIHGLVARDIITVGDAVEIVAAATEVNEQVGVDIGDSPATLQRSLALLRAIQSSLAMDMAR